MASGCRTRSPNIVWEEQIARPSNPGTSPPVRLLRSLARPLQKGQVGRVRKCFQSISELMSARVVEASSGFCKPSRAMVPPPQSGWVDSPTARFAETLPDRRRWPCVLHHASRLGEESRSAQRATHLASPTHWPIPLCSRRGGGVLAASPTNRICNRPTTLLSGCYPVRLVQQGIVNARSICRLGSRGASRKMRACIWWVPGPATVAEQV